ncbi:MAG: ribosome maturation factor RimP [Bacilli bacterium]|nr:ribosome maturation factor RimP [Bacilli bacterium]
MDVKSLESKLKEKINLLGYDFVSLSSKKDKGDLFLSIVVDKVEPIDMNMIVSLSEELSKYLDEIDNSNEPYILDISSLGAEKPLKIESLKDYVNRYVHVHVINPIKGENIFEGDLVEVKDNEITVAVRNKTRVNNIVILLSNIYKIRLAIKF